MNRTGFPIACLAIAFALVASPMVAARLPQETAKQARSLDLALRNASSGVEAASLKQKKRAVLFTRRPGGQAGRLRVFGLEAR